MTYDEVVENLTLYENLGENWNSYGARPIPVAAVKKAKSLLDEYFTNHLPMVFPTGYRTVQFEWEKDGAYFEVEVGEEEIGFLLMLEGYKTVENDDATFEEVNKAYGKYLDYILDEHYKKNDYSDDDFWRNVL